jgi:hypothetical protein
MFRMISMRGSERRSFLFGGSGLLLGIFGTRKSSANPEPEPQQPQPAVSPNAQYSGPLTPKAVPRPAGYPRPQYLPEGYVRTGTWADIGGGFGVPGEIMEAFQNGELMRLPQITSLIIYIAPETAFLPAFDAQDRVPARRVVRTTLGEDVTINYYDGMWHGTTSSELPSPDRVRRRFGGINVWDTDNFHSVLFNFHGYSVMIRGCRAGNVSMEELFKIAGSFTI